MRWLFLLGAMTLTAGGAAAQSAPGAGLADQCTTAGGFGERFGATQFAGRVRNTAGNRVSFDPATPAPPFAVFDAGVTQWSRKIFRIGAVAEFRDDQAARAAYAAMLEVIAARGWTRTEEGDSVEFVSDPRDGVGTKVSISLLGRGVWLDCVDRAGEAAAFKEAFGPAPDIAKRPERPALPRFPTLPTEADCAAAEKRAAILADPMVQMDAVVGFADPLLKYAELLSEWKGQQLVKRGVWTEARRTRFWLDFLQDPRFASAFSKGMDGVTAMIGTMVAMGEAEQRGDALGQCRAAVQVLGQMVGVVKSVEVQWQVVHDAYALEAARLGVELE